MTEYIVPFRVVLTVEADTPEEAKKIAQCTLEMVDHWPTVEQEGQISLL